MAASEDPSKLQMWLSVNVACDAERQVAIRYWRLYATGQLREVSMMPSVGMAYRPSTKLAAAFCTRCIRSKDHLMIS